jgi:hypothetical protein
MNPMESFLQCGIAKARLINRNETTLGRIQRTGSLASCLPVFH